MMNSLRRTTRREPAPPHAAVPGSISMDQELDLLFGEIERLRERLRPLPRGLRREYEELLKGLSGSAAKLGSRVSARVTQGQARTPRQMEELNALKEHLARINGLFSRRMSSPGAEQRRLLDLENGF